MNRRIYYAATDGIIVLVTDAKRTVAEEAKLYRIKGVDTADTLAVEKDVSAAFLRRLRDYRIDVDTLEFVWSGEGPEPVDPTPGGGGGGGQDTALRQEVEELAIEVASVRELAEQAKTQAVDGKAGLSAALEDMGVPASPADTFAELANKIRTIYNGKRTKYGTFATLAPSAATVVNLGFAPSFYIVNAENGAAYIVSAHEDVPGLNFTAGALTATVAGEQLTIRNTGSVQTRSNINYFAVE